uniref:Uncharacterized protein n=1 Tax=Rhizophora mucronata TaxID=61149 RepID=A0A2P2NUD3_RHIMU
MKNPNPYSSGSSMLHLMVLQPKCN